MKCCVHILILLSLLLTVNATAQTVKQTVDSTLRADTLKLVTKDTIRIKDTVEKHTARKATLRSALIPGWGQAYNREYWKIPLVYTAIGIPVGFFIYNNSWYKRTKKAFDILINKDTSRYPDIDKKLSGLSADNVRYYRNQFRRDRDYSILYTLVAWGLNVADATVFGHLKDFDVSDDLSFSVKPGFSPNANTTGISLVLATKKHTERFLHFGK